MSAILFASLLVLCGCANICPKNKITETCSNSTSLRHHKCEDSQNQSDIVTTTYREPQNIALLEQEIKAWYSSGGYERSMDQVGNKASQYLTTCKDIPGKLAVVMDIDETALSNWKMEMGENFSVSKKSLDEWQSKSEAVAIEPTLRLFNQAKKQNMATFFLSGRKEKFRIPTEENLKKVGYRNWTKTIFKPNDSEAPTTQFKTEERKKIEESGYRIVLNLGDQYSDFGAYADKNFKYPNPFYYVP